MHNNTIASQIYTKISFKTTLNQKIIVEKLSKWLMNPDFRSIFVLNGYAGTGKTTIISALVHALDELKIRSVLLAPTGRAANILARYSSHTANTIHKRIYRQRNMADYDSKFSLDFNRERSTIFIVDEASMLSTAAEGSLFGSGSLLDDLVSYVRSGHECRLLLVGDSAQLPPVGEERSPALDEGTMGEYGDVEYATMDEVVRQQATSGILFNATLVRCMLERGIYDIPRFDLSFADVESIEGGEFTERLQDAYDKYGSEETIIITRSNKRASRYNEGVRRYTLCREEAIESGDVLMTVKNNYYYTEQQKESRMSFIANGDVAELVKIKRFEEFYGFEFARAVLYFRDYDQEMECNILLDTLSSDAPALSWEDNKRLFTEVEKDYEEITNRRKRYDQIRQNPHYNALQVKFSYAVTCHKAQGGQWRAVFVDRCIFGDETMSRDMLRWLYTAITRATDRLYFVNFDERFF